MKVVIVLVHGACFTESIGSLSSAKIDVVEFRGTIHPSIELNGHALFLEDGSVNAIVDDCWEHFKIMFEPGQALHIGCGEREYFNPCYCNKCMKLVLPVPAEKPLISSRAVTVRPIAPHFCPMCGGEMTHRIEFDRVDDNYEFKR